MKRLLGGDRIHVASNVVARVGALVALGVATILVARSGGAGDVGLFALLRVLPGLAGVLVSCGLPTAIPFFVSSKDDPATRSTIVALTVIGALAAALLWVLGSPVLRMAFFREQTLALIIWCAMPVFTQQFVAVGKALLQGRDDMNAANVAIVAEEAMFLPMYLALLPFLHGPWHLLVALVAADVLVAGGIWVRLARRGHLGRWTRPRLALMREVLLYGMRGQVGGVLLLLNLRLDFALLGAIAGPAVLGIYAIASKYAELLRLPGLAITYVLYPRFAKRGADVALRRTTELLTGSTVLTVVAAFPLMLAAGFVLPLLYGAEFRSAVVPAWILIAGLTTEGAAGLVTAYLYATRRPGLNSLAIGAGLVVTAALDVLLIPRYGARGAAVASTMAYLTTTAVQMGFFVVLRRRQLQSESAAPAPVPEGPRSARLSVESS